MKQNTKRLYSMIFALLFLIIALVAYFDLMVPAYTDLQIAKGNQISQQNLLDNEKVVVSQIQTLLATYQSQSSEQQAINSALPVGPNVASALAQLYGISNATNVSIQNLNISSQLSQVSASTNGVADAAATGQISKPVGTITFTLSVTGSYESFKTFIKTLETNMRFFDVKQVSFRPAVAAGGKGFSNLFTYAITVATYYQSP